MKITTRYECEICGLMFDNAPQALTCEARGRGDASPYPRGLIFNSAASRGNFYKRITFVVCEAHGDRHRVAASLWAFRDNGAGDSLGLTDTCGDSNSFELFKGDVPSPEHPTFARAVAFLKRHKIPAYIWDGKKAVPYRPTKKSV